MWMWEQGGDAAYADGLGASVQWEGGFAQPLDRQLELPVQVALLDYPEQGAMGKAMVG
jgi:hypothetical protein